MNLCTLVKIHPNCIIECDKRRNGMGTGKSMYLGIPDCNKNCDYSKYKMPLVEICGQKRVLIENHLGIVDYKYP